jgi:hypothetical protein
MQDLTRKFAEHLVNTYYADRFNAACEGLDIGDIVDAYLCMVDGIETRIREYWRHWQAHPQFAAINAVLPQKPHNPYVTIYWKHDEPGVGKETHSYMWTSLEEAFAPATRKWASRSLGTFDGVGPIDHAVTCLSWERQTYMSLSLKGSGRAYRARMKLRALLPKRFHKLTTSIRAELRHHRKWWYLANSMDTWIDLPREEKEAIKNKKSLQPAWYRNADMAELWATRRLDKATYKDLARYIDPAQFFRCASGAIHPDDVAQYVVHQMDLFEVDFG